MELNINMDKLTVLHDDNSSFTDYSSDAFDFTRDNFTVDYTAVEDYIYIGYYKPFANLFFGVKTTGALGGMSLEYYKKDVGFTAFEANLDDTRDLSRSGFLNYDRELDDWDTFSVGSVDLFWIRVSFASSDTVVLEGINTLFSYDNDLKEKYREINEYLGSDTSFIAFHQSSRKDIIQKIRNSGKVKVSSINGTMTDLNQWDFLRPEQLREASAYLSLSKIFAGISDSVDGKFMQLQNQYRKQYKEAVETFLTNVDLDDDGNEDSNESDSSAVKYTRIHFI